MKTRRFDSKPGVMGCALALALTFTGQCCVTVRLVAQDDFVPPQAYGTDRYEEGWNKNPFTLKADPGLGEKSLFGQDLAIATYFGDKNDPTMVIVNTKTHERTALRKGVASQDGITLKSWLIKPSRVDTVAEIVRGGETAVLHYDDSFIKAQAAKGGAAGGRRGEDKAGAGALDAGVVNPAPGAPGAPGVQGGQRPFSRNPAMPGGGPASSTGGPPPGLLDPNNVDRENALIRGRRKMFTAPIPESAKGTTPPAR